MLAKDKLDSSRLESLTDSEEQIAELSRRHDRDKLLLLEENKKLIIEVEQVRLLREKIGAVKLT